MKVSTHLIPERIHLKVLLQSKADVFRFISESLEKSRAVKRAPEVFDALMKRENLMSTGIGGGIGIPHGLIKDIDEVLMTLVTLKRPIVYESIDGRPVDVVIGLIAPEHEATLHLRALAGISGLCRRPGFLDLLRKSEAAEPLWEIIRQADERSDAV